MKKINANSIIDGWVDKAKEAVDNVIDDLNTRPINVKKLSETAIIPTKNNATDAGFDLYADEDIQLISGCQNLVSTSIALEIPDGYVGLIWPRSGLSAKHGIDVLAGVIDSGYRGEIKVCLLLNCEVIQDANGNVCSGVYDIKKGDKIAQILIQEIPVFKMLEVDNLSESTRGDKGFGSSGR